MKVKVKIRFMAIKDLGFDPWRHSEPFIWVTYQKNVKLKQKAEKAVFQDFGYDVTATDQKLNIYVP